MIFKLSDLIEIMQKAKQKGSEYIIASRDDDNLLIITANPNEEEFVFMTIEMYEYEIIGNTIYCKDTSANKWIIPADEIYGFYEDENNEEVSYD